MFYLISTFNFGIPPVLVFKLEDFYKVDKKEQLLNGIQIKHLQKDEYLSNLRRY